MTNTVLIKCPCCNHVLTIAVSCDVDDRAKEPQKPTPVMPIAVDTSIYKVKLHEMWKSLEKMSKESSSKPQPVAPTKEEQADIYVEMNIDELKKEINHCTCGVLGYCNKCVEKSYMIDRLEKYQKNLPNGLKELPKEVECPHCKGAGYSCGIQKGQPTTFTCNVCDGKGKLLKAPNPNGTNMGCSHNGGGLHTWKPHVEGWICGICNEKVTVC